MAMKVIIGQEWNQFGIFMTFLFLYCIYYCKRRCLHAAFDTERPSARPKFSGVRRPYGLDGAAALLP